MSQENVQQVSRGYRLFDHGDFDRLAEEIFHPDTEWREPDAQGYPFAGTRRSFGAVVEEIFAEIPRYYSEFRVLPEEFVDGGDTVVVLGRFAGAARDTKRRFDIPFCHVYTLRDGKIARARNFTDTASHIRALGRQVEPA